MQKQCDRILAYMREFGGTTQLEALRDLGVMRLASRISEMRKNGVAVGSGTLHVKNRYGEDCCIKKYWLEGDADGL